MEYPFGGEGGEDLFTLSTGGRRPHGGSLPFEQGCDKVDIFLRLIGHEDGVDLGGGCVLDFRECFSASCVPFRAIEYNGNGKLDIVLM